MSTTNLPVPPGSQTSIRKQRGKIASSRQNRVFRLYMIRIHPYLLSVAHICKALGKKNWFDEKSCGENRNTTVSRLYKKSLELKGRIIWNGPERNLIRFCPGGCDKAHVIWKGETWVSFYRQLVEKSLRQHIELEEWAILYTARGFTWCFPFPRRIHKFINLPLFSPPNSNSDTHAQNPIGNSPVRKKLRWTPHVLSKSKSDCLQSVWTAPIRYAQIIKNTETWFWMKINGFRTTSKGQ